MEPTNTHLRKYTPPQGKLFSSILTLRDGDHPWIFVSPYMYSSGEVVDRILRGWLPSVKLIDQLLVDSEDERFKVFKWVTCFWLGVPELSSSANLEKLFEDVSTLVGLPQGDPKVVSITRVIEGAHYEIPCLQDSLSPWTDKFNFPHEIIGAIYRIQKFLLENLSLSVDLDSRDNNEEDSTLKKSVQELLTCSVLEGLCETVDIAKAVVCYALGVINRERLIITWQPLNCSTNF